MFIFFGRLRILDMSRPDCKIEGIPGVGSLSCFR